MDESPDFFAAERRRMVEHDLAGRGLRDARVLEACRRLPRELFVPEDQREAAYADHPLRLSLGQTISQPYMVALMTERLALAGSERVLEVGTGSGYQTALLGLLAGEVWTVERLPELAASAAARLGALAIEPVPPPGLTTKAPRHQEEGKSGLVSLCLGGESPPGAPRFPKNLHYRTGDGTLGWPEAAPFDRILVTAAAPRVPAPLREQLAEGGRLVVPVGDAIEQDLVLVERRGGEFRETRGEGCIFVRLIGRAGWPDEALW